MLSVTGHDMLAEANVTICHAHGRNAYSHASHVGREVSKELCASDEKFGQLDAQRTHRKQVDSKRAGKQGNICSTPVQVLCLDCLQAGLQASNSCD